MATHDSTTLAQSNSITHDLTKQRLMNTLAMLVSAVLAFFVAGTIAPNIDGFRLSVVAATAFTVGVCCAPNDYRSRGGSLSWAITLIAFTWTVPVIVVVTFLAS
jgi:hypothetical protein